MKAKPLFCALIFLAGFTLVAKSHDKDGATDSAALKNATILIIRHAEKPAGGDGLSAEGERRAQLYAGYFKNFTVDGQPLKLNCIFAAADSKESRRPRLTIEPTARALGLPVDSRFKDKDFPALAGELRARPHGTEILIAWHHGEIPRLLRALGADPETVIPKAKWPEDVFGWVIELRYDAAGRLAEARRINENLLPDDANRHSLKP